MVAVNLPRSRENWAPSPGPSRPRVLRPDTPLNDVPRRPRALPDRATRVRRRRLAALVAALVLALAVAGAVQAAVWLADVGSSPAPEALDPGTAQRVAGQVYVVQPGDTLWSIAAEIAPDRDPRAVVDALREANGGGVALEAGQRLTIVLD
jgi:Tfp pilus assembly protein FimV